MLEEEGYLDSFGTLVLKFCVRPYNYHQVTMDQNDYIKKLLKSNENSYKLIKTLLKQLKAYENINDEENDDSDLNNSSEEVPCVNETMNDFDNLCETKHEVQSEEMIPPHHCIINSLSKLSEFMSDEERLDDYN